MKTALVTTTINIPAVLALYRRFDPTASVRFFVAGDMKSPSLPSIQFCRALDNCKFYDVVEQEILGYKCSDLIGWNTDARRNIVLLEALKWGADIIIFSDDDNYPISPNYFHSFVDILTEPFSGLQAWNTSNWVDPGQLLDPIVQQRGIPFNVVSPVKFHPIVHAKVGVAYGACLGDPDVAAVTRLERAPIVHRVSEVLRQGFVVQPKSHTTVFNSQNIAVIREVAPAMFVWPGSGTHEGAGRNSDIYASLVTQRVMRDRNLCTHIGPPFIWQERNPHNLISDLRGEIWAMENVERFASFLENIDLRGGESSVVNDLRGIYEHMKHEPWIPERAWKAGLAFLEDCEEVL